MNRIDTAHSLVKHIRRELRDHGLQLVAAKDRWLLNSRNLDSWYVANDLGDVVGHYFDLLELDKDLQALRDKVTSEGRNTPMAARSCVDGVVDPMGCHVMDIHTNLDAINAPPSSDEVEERYGLLDEQGRLWVDDPSGAQMNRSESNYPKSITPGDKLPVLKSSHRVVSIDIDEGLAGAVQAIAHLYWGQAPLDFRSIVEDSLRRELGRMEEVLHYRRIQSDCEMIDFLEERSRRRELGKQAPSRAETFSPDGEVSK